MNAQEMFATDFLSLSFDEQEQLINNCLVHSATMIDTKTKKETDKESIENGFEKAFVNGLKVSAMTYINNDDVRQTAWLLAIEKANNKELFDMPLLYMLCKCTNKALSDCIYGNIKGGKSDTIDTDTPIAVYFDNVETKVLNDIERTEIFDYLPNGIKVNAILALDLMECGYTVAEIIDYMGITEKTFSQWMSAVINAVAISKAANKEFKAAKIIHESKRARQNKAAFKAAEKAIADMLNGCESYNKPSKKTAALRNWLNSDYMERIKFITYHKDDFKMIFNLK